MVWPFASRDTSSAASFEKSLAQLSTRINHQSALTNSLRTSQRRFKALWTLYASFAYILILAILLLVTGWDSWNIPEYAAVTCSPPLIYGVRKALGAYYGWRIGRCETRLKEAESERGRVIEKLKKATKYDSTQQLLDKYGGAPKQQQQQDQQRPRSPKRKSSRQSMPAQLPSGPRTGFAPPPTANIPARQPVPRKPLDASSAAANASSPSQPPPPSLAPGESFAPNAFFPSSSPMPPHAPPPQHVQAAQGPAWYDRILDLVLGEDETSSKNRFALICARCRLVNGQAPPGARSLEDVGKWKCRECGAMNGVESEAGKVLEQARGRGVEVGQVEVEDVARDFKVEESEETPESEEVESDAVDAPPASSTRSKARQRRKV